MNNNTTFAEIPISDLYMVEGGINVFNTVASICAITGILGSVCPPLYAVSLVSGCFCLGYSLAQ